MKRDRRNLWLASSALVLLAALATPTIAQNILGGRGGLFTPSDRCMACHNGLVDVAGDDVSIGFDWRPTMMANSSRDPYWRAAIRREALDHPSAVAAIEDECTACHMPMATFEMRSVGGLGQAFVYFAPAAGTAQGMLALDGVSCSMCHQIQDEGLGERSSFVAGFAVDATTPWDQRAVLGPHEVDAGRTRIMHSASAFAPQGASHVASAELCATCHTLYTHALGPDGEVIGELPEQVPYLEWRHSAHAPDRTCADCHMQVLDGGVAISSVWGQPRPGVSRHVFRGGNTLVPRMLNALRAELGTVALPQEIAASLARTEAHLQTRSATLTVASAELSDGQLAIDVAITNLAGHKLPTAYPSRRAWLHLAVRDAGGALVFESGALAEDGSIAGNDNDADGSLYEPHYDLIERPDQVQIYESIMVGPDGAVTTGLLTATTFAKDNRLLPLGFDEASADADIAVRGRARDDHDHRGGEDRVSYRIDAADAEGPFGVSAELWYQPIGYRWALNLADYEAPEPGRFAAAFDAVANASATLLASDSATIEGGAEPHLAP
jgi:hypothetical protein